MSVCENNYKNERFDSYLNKTIILSSRKYYALETTKDINEIKIIDDVNYSKFVNEFIKYDDIYDFDNIYGFNNFIELCDNSVLVHSLESLSNIEKTVIFLLFEKQLTSSEASKILKICSDSVTRIKRRALNKIEKYLKGDE